MVPKFSHETAERMLARLDKIASTIQANAHKWGMDFKTAKDLVNALDKTADEIEVSAFGEQSFLTRQAEVIDMNKDESYMDTFENPMAPIQTDRDETYMSAYKDDQSSAVNNGKSETGRKLAP